MCNCLPPITETSSVGPNMLARAMVAGSVAGITEHAVMFPIDTVKTRMQVVPGNAIPQNINSLTALAEISRKEGISRLYRGAPLVALCAIPAHALYFGAYETTRKLLGATRTRHQPLQTALAGVTATMGHDIISTPIDVIKQRLQMTNSPIKTYWDGFLSTSFNQMFRSYPTTVLLNIPMVVVNFMVYESLTLLMKSRTDTSDSIPAHLVCGGIAGGLSGFLSTPLDVVRTRIQTDCECGKRPIRCVIKSVLQHEGWRGLWAGYGARTIYYIPSAALTWTVYETVKKTLGWQEDIPEVYKELL